MSTTTTFVQKINGKDLYAARAVATASGVNIDTKFEQIEQEITAHGSYEVVPLTSGANPVPDVAEPKTTVIYLTKESGSSKTDPYTEWIYIPAGQGTSASWEIIGETTIDLSGYKQVQTAVVDPTAHATDKAVEFIDTISQDTQGVITPTKKAIREATTSQTGIVQLAGSIGATVASENNKAATEKAVRDAINDLDVAAVTVGASKTLVSISEEDGKISTSAVDIQIAESQVTNLVDDLASKQDNLSFEGTYDASTNKVATESTVSDAIEALDVSAISVGADKTLTSISETDGKISATPVAIQIAESQVTNLTTDLAAKADKVASATSGNFAGLDSNGNLTDSGSKATDFATAAQGGKADSAIQSVSVNGTALTPDANNGVDVPVATGSTYGVVTIGTIDITE